MEKYTTISLPYVFHRKLSKFIKENPRLGYSSTAEFAREAIRVRLAEVKEETFVIVLRELRNLPYRNWDEKWDSFRDIARKKV